MKKALEKFVLQGSNLVIVLEAIRDKDPLEFTKYQDVYNALRCFMELIRFTDLNLDKVRYFSSTTSDFVAAIVMGKGEVDLRILFESVFGTHSKISMRQISMKAGVTQCTAGNYRNHKKTITTDTWERLVNEMIK